MIEEFNAETPFAPTSIIQVAPVLSGIEKVPVLSLKSFEIIISLESALFVACA